MINVDSSVKVASELLSAREAARMLGVKLETLYAYASRGLVRSVGGSRTEGHAYRREDLERLLLRKRARSGHAATAASAMRWGEPVVDTAISTINPTRGPIYRGHTAVELAARGTSFESAAELLFTGALPSSRPKWSARADLVRLSRDAVARTRRTATPLGRLFLALSVIAASTPNRSEASSDPSLELALGRAVILALASVAGAHAVAPAASVAETLARSLDLRVTTSLVARLDTALVLLANHELNASTFTARVAASAGASQPSSMLAALGTLAGSRHGGAAGEVETLLAACGANTTRAALTPFLSEGRAIPGFHHMLYPSGDPRFAPLLEMARAARPRGRAVRLATELSRAVKRGRGEHPTVDLGLVALGEALGAPRGAASILFAIARSAGWIAHVLEQRRQGYLLRPRARYVGA